MSASLAASCSCSKANHAAVELLGHAAGPLLRCGCSPGWCRRPAAPGAAPPARSFFPRRQGKPSALAAIRRSCAPNPLRPKQSKPSSIRCPSRCALFSPRQTHSAAGVPTARHRARRSRNGKGFFHLAQNLRLAHDHRVEAGSHAEQMPHGFLVAVLKKMWMQDFRFNPKVTRQKTGQPSFRRLRPRPAAPRDCMWKQSCTRSLRASQPEPASCPAGLRANGDLLPQRDGRRFVVHADELQRHCGPNL